MKQIIRKLISRKALCRIDELNGKIKTKIERKTDAILAIRKMRLKKMYRQRTGMQLNFKKCSSFNEKVQWLKVHYFDYKMVLASDKILAKRYLKERGLGEYVPKLLESYDSTNEINFEKLPDKFVIKTTNGSGSVIVCENKKNLDYELVKEELNSWMHQKYGFYTKEWFYDIVRPRILVEEYIDYVGQELYDYKLICFNGKMKLAFVVMNRKSKEGMYVDFYDRDWNKLEFSRKYSISNCMLPRPKEWEDMLRIAEYLGNEFPLVRVDFYIGRDQLYIGELTFCPGSGWEVFEPIEYDYVYGKELSLPGKKVCQEKKKELKKFIQELKSKQYQGIEYWDN